MSHATPSSRADIDQRFNYHLSGEDRVVTLDYVRGQCAHIAHCLDEVLPPGREKSLALTKLEEALMWSNASIAKTAPQPVGTVRSGVISIEPATVAELIDPLVGPTDAAAGPSA